MCPAARAMGARRPEPSAAATSSTLRAGAASLRVRSRKALSSVPVSGTGSGPAGTASRPDAPGSSISASGLPPVLATNRSRSAGATRSPSSAAAASGASPVSPSSARPAASTSRPSPSRAASSRQTASASSRRATNANASSDGPSHQCASSTRHSTGPASESSVSAATETRNGCVGSPAVSPNAVRSAAACGSGSASRRSSSGSSSWCSAAYASVDSASTPTARSTRMPSARRAAYSSSADFPMPGSPRTTSPAPRCERAREIISSMSFCSLSRPTSTHRC